MNLDQQLAELRARAASLPDNVRTTMQSSLDELIAAHVSDGALRIGDVVPDFELPNQRGETVAFSDIVAKGPLVISFYRGGWCPYCNLEMRALQQRLPEIMDLG